MSLIRGNRPEPGTGATRLIALPPDFERALRYFESHAPERLPPPAKWPDPERMSFVTRGLAPVDAFASPATANVRFADVDGDARLELLVSDMRSGAVMIGRAYLGRRALTPLAELSNPAHVSIADFDKDGILDLFVADLGRFMPSDHNQGAVVLLRGKGALKYDTLALDGWPRVADVETGDFNGDGTLDLLVAAFGWRTTGKVAVLENHTIDYRQPSFIERVIDTRPGAIHAVPADVNGDGRLDFIAVLSQQFDTVVAYCHIAWQKVKLNPTPICYWGGGAGCCGTAVSLPGRARSSR